MSEVIIRPTIVDGIEFYVAPTGEAGMSVSGLARLCGVDANSLKKRLKKHHATPVLEEEKTAESIAITESPPRAASAFQGIELEVKAERNARVIRDDVCAEVVEYYAFDSEWATDIALYSYRKFARLGIRAWIHQVTGYAQANDLNKLAETMNLLLKEVQDLRVETREYKAVRRQSDGYFPGLNDLMDELADTEVKALPSGDSDGRFTVAEWLATRGISLDKSQLHKLAAMAAFTYRTLAKKDPTIVYRHSTQASKTKKVNGYLEAEFPILSIALTKLFQP